MKKFTVLFVAGMLVSMGVTAEIYKCTEVDGVVGYTDKPCAGDSTIFIPRPGPNADKDVNVRKKKRQRLLRAYSEEDAAEKKKAAELKAESERRLENCRRARINYQRFTQAGHVFRTNSDGERVVFTDKERAEATARAQADIEKWCDR